MTRLTDDYNHQAGKPFSKLSKVQLRILEYIATAPAFSRRGPSGTSIDPGLAFHAELLAEIFGLEPRYPRSGPGYPEHIVNRRARAMAVDDGRPNDWILSKYQPETVEYTSFRHYLALTWSSSNHFDPGAIGRARYNAAKASLSRSLRRLKERGLVEVHEAYWIESWVARVWWRQPAHVRLTAAGREAAAPPKNTAHPGGESPL